MKKATKTAPAEVAGTPAIPAERERLLVEARTKYIEHYEALQLVETEIRFLELSALKQLGLSPIDGWYVSTGPDGCEVRNRRDDPPPQQS